MSPGSGFFAEEPGWFRVSFTVAKDAMLVPLESLVKCLQEIKADGWEP